MTPTAHLRCLLAQCAHKAALHAVVCLLLRALLHLVLLLLHHLQRVEEEMD